MAREDEGLQRFLTQATRHRILTAAEERSLATAARTGDTRARHELFECNLRLVISVSRGYTGRGMDYADLIQEGMVGLDRATHKFDPRKGYKFSTYAVWWIRQSIQRALLGNGAIRLPPEVARIRLKAREALLKDPETNLDDLAKALKIDRVMLERCIDAAEIVTSLDREAYDEPGEAVVDATPDPNAHDPGSVYILHDRDAVLLRSAVAALPRFQRRVLTLMFGLDGTEPMGVKGVAEALDKPRLEVSKARDTALEALKREPSLSGLGSLLH